MPSNAGPGIPCGSAEFSLHCVLAELLLANHSTLGLGVAATSEQGDAVWVVVNHRADVCLSASVAQSRAEI